MEQKNNMESEKREVVEFDNTSKEELEGLARNLMTQEEQGELMNGELDLILRIARKKIATMDNAPSIHDAIADAAIIRLGVKEYSRIMAMDKEGNVVGSGTNREEAIRKAQESTGK